MLDTKQATESCIFLANGMRDDGDVGATLLMCLHDIGVIHIVQSLPAQYKQVLCRLPVERLDDVLEIVSHSVRRTSVPIAPTALCHVMCSLLETASYTMTRIQALKLHRTNSLYTHATPPTHTPAPTDTAECCFLTS